MVKWHKGKENSRVRGKANGSGKSRGGVYSGGLFSLKSTSFTIINAGRMSNLFNANWFITSKILNPSKIERVIFDRLIHMLSMYFFAFLVIYSMCNYTLQRLPSSYIKSFVNN